MNAPHIVPIVEGQGEIQAIRVLLKRIFNSFGCNYVSVDNPIRIKSGSFIEDRTYFEKYHALASLKAAQAKGIVLITLDCENACPAELGPRLLKQARTVRSDIPCIVCLAYREYETWFLAAAKSLRGQAGLPDDLVAPTNPEDIRGAKEWLGKRMAERYDPIRHQASFTRHFDLLEAQRVPSFKRLVGKLENFCL